MVDQKPISVIIPTYNKLTVLVDTLGALETQTLPVADFEIIIVDDGSTDGTQDWLHSQTWHFDCNILSQPNLGAGAARNYGANKAGGQILLFLDADIVATPNLLERHQCAQQQYDHSLIMGRVQSWPGAKTSPTYNIFASMYDMGSKEILLNYPFCLTQNLSISTEDFIFLHGFNEKLLWGEDTEFSYRAGLAGLDLRYFPQALAYHNHPLSLNQICEKTQRDHCRLGILFKEHPEIIYDLAYLQDKLPLHWNQDPIPLLFRKLMRSLLATTPLHSSLRLICLSAERLRIPDRWIHFLTWKAIGAYQWIGLRDGMHKFGWNLIYKPSRRRISNRGQIVLPEEASLHEYAISVIIPAYNKCKELSETLNALRNQTIHNSDFEVILIDDGSTDGTLDWLSIQSWPFACKVLSQPNQGAGAARNYGARQAKGQVMLFLDADIIGNPDLLQQHWKAHQVHEHSLVMGRVQQWPGTKTSPTYHVIASMYDMGAKEKLLDYPFGLTQNLSIPATFFAFLGGFDAHLPRGQDTEFSYRAMQAGFELSYDPQALAYHNHPLSLNQICEKTQYDHCELGVLFQENPEIVLDLDYLCDKLPIHWGNDTPNLIFKKFARAILALMPIRATMYSACLAMERTLPYSPGLDFLVWKTLGAYQWIGLREGMQKYGWKLP